MPHPIRAMNPVLATFALGALVGCATTGPEPIPAPIAGTSGSVPPPALATPRLGAPIDPALPLCERMLLSRARTGATCRAVGVLARREFTSKGGAVIDTWPVLVLADGSPLMLESIWLPDTKLEAATITALEGQPVEVAGKLHDVPPGSIQNWTHAPTLAPVSAIRRVGP